MESPRENLVEALSSGAPTTKRDIVCANGSDCDRPYPGPVGREELPPESETELEL